MQENILLKDVPGRFGEIDGIGPIVAIYCSQLASFCHGAIIPVDAGQSKHFIISITWIKNEVYRCNCSFY